MNDFDALVREAFYSFLEYRPDIATKLGLHQYDKLMPSGSRESHEAFIEKLSWYLSQVQSLQEELSREKHLERNLMVSLLRYHLFKEKEVRRWEKDPDPGETIGFAIYFLFTREFAPFEERLESITARLSKCPQFIEEFKSRIKTPVTLWVDVARESCLTLPLFFQIISTTASQKGLETHELEEASARTEEALSHYVEWLSTLPSEEGFAIGRQRFKTLLELREIGLNSDEILKMGEDYLRKEKARLKELASILDPSSSVKEVRTSLRELHPPTFKETLTEYEKAIAKVRGIVSREGFASVPEGEKLIVQETPPFLRHVVPVAAYTEPGRFEKDQTGIYFVTPAEGDLLREHSYTGIVNTSVHEAYPGHHLQAVWANKHPSLVRLLSEAPEFAEGWAHYCEERIQNYGLKDTKLEFIQALDVIFRAARIIIDIKLHRNEMTFEEAVSFLMGETGMEREAAKADVKWYTKEPGYPLSYLLGKHLFLQLQRDVQSKMKDHYSDRVFHDALLQGGNIPFKYVREELKLRGML